MCNFRRETGRFCVFEPLWGLEATYDIHRRFIVKCVVEFLLVLIKLLLNVTVDERRAKIDWKSIENRSYRKKLSQFGRKFQVQVVVPIFLVAKLDWLSFFVIKDFGKKFFGLLQFTRLFHRRTDGCIMADTHLHCIALLERHILRYVNCLNKPLQSSQVKFIVQQRAWRPLTCCIHNKIVVYT